MEKTINISGREVRFRASALTPRIYRAKTGRDMFTDIATLEKAIGVAAEKHEALPPSALTIFEDVAFTLAKQADASIPATADEWLDTFDIFDIYVVLPQILSVWRTNTATTAKAKKNKTNSSTRYRRSVHVTLR